MNEPKCFGNSLGVLGSCEQASQSVGENSALVYVYIQLGVRCLERRVAEMECVHAVFM